MIRPATASDARAIARVKVEGWRTTYLEWVPEHAMARYLDVERQAVEVEETLRRPEDVVMVAEDDESGDVIGVAVAETMERAEPFLETLHVLPDRRSHGIGKQLVRAVAVELAARGHRAMTLGVVEQNTGAMRFYERLGATAKGKAAALWAPDDVVEVTYRFADLTAV